MKGMKGIASVLLLANSAVWAGSMQEQAAFPFSFTISKGQPVTLALSKGKLSAKLPGGSTQTLVAAEPLEGGVTAEPIPVALVADFNFDGMQDVAIQDGIGYNGVNVFHRLYLWDKASKKFTEYPETISNPALDVKQQTLTSSARSGPLWSYTEYHVAKGKLYPAEENQMLAAGDGAWEYLTFKNASGKVTGHKVVGEVDGKAGDAIASIAIDKAPLYDKPKASAKTKMYVVKGDKVTLLDWKEGTDGALGAGWFLIRYHGKKVIEKWIASDALVKG